MATAVASFEDSASSRPTARDGFLTQSIVWVLLFCVVFVNAADFRGDTGEKFAVHWQIYLRLLICGICGSVGLLMFSRSYREFLTMPGMLITMLIAWIGATIPFSIDKGYSIAAYVALGSVVMLIPSAMKTLGGYRYLTAIATGLLTFLVGSWIAYFVFPEVGVFKEQVTRTEVVERMGGLGHPNELGFYSAYTVVLFAVLGYGRRLTWLIAGPAILFAIATLIICFSRTSIVITFIGLFVVYRRELFKLGNVLAAIILPMIVLPLAFVVIGSGQLDWILEDLGQKISKSGSSDELSTATGRTEIWAYGIEKIGEQPLYGYGYGTARFVMEDYSYHCHNIVLNMSMYAGVIGGLILVAIILYFLYQMIYRPRYEVDGLVAIIIFGGMIEGMLVAPVPHVSMLIWVGALFWRQLEMEFNPDLDVQRRIDMREESAGS